MLVLKVTYTRWVSQMRLKLLLTLSCCLVPLYPVESKEYSLGTQSESQMVNARVLESPSPEIPSDYKDEAFKSTIMARFSIAADAKVKVELLSSSGNADIDKIVLNTLKKWKFKPATLDDVPVASTRKLKIDLEVE